jgi:hypothetical protein
VVADGASVIEEMIRSTEEELRAATTAAARQERLQQLRTRLGAMATHEASSAIRRFLDSNTDAGTGLGFKVGGHGFLKEAPTLRTYLLDYLGQSDPQAAADYAKIILNHSTSPDEWAVALRNLALGDASTTGRVLLEDRTRELLRNEAWQKEQTVGYLEAFDAAVYLGGTNLAPTLADLVRKQDNPAVAHAAYLALDRLVINNPASLLTALEGNPDLMQGREQTRANYFARADVRDAQQRQVLESYLLDPRITPAELGQFAGLFPNANYMISQNLLTPAPTPDHAALVGRDAASLQTVQEWMGDARFSKLQPQLQTMKQRLEEFVRQAQR